MTDAELPPLDAPDPETARAQRAAALARMKTLANATLAGMAALCREKLASFKVPRNFIVVEKLPRNAMGKIQKHLLPQS